MSLYIDHCNVIPFNSTSRLNRHEQAIEGHKAMILLTIKRAFEEYPLDTIRHHTQRWNMIYRRGLDPAYEAFRFLLGFDAKEEEALDDELDHARDATYEFNIDDVIEAASSYLAIIERRAEREAL